MNIRVNPDWQNQNIRCHICFNTKSVKYLAEVFDPLEDSKPTTVPVCNRCALFYACYEGNTTNKSNGNS